MRQHTPAARAGGIEERAMASVDRIVVDENGTARILKPEQWKALPLKERVKLVSRATFYAGTEVVPAKQAVSQLK
jgi:hypothetical protein